MDSGFRRIAFDEIDDESIEVILSPRGVVKITVSEEMDCQLVYEPNSWPELPCSSILCFPVADRLEKS
jgi:hypothetical protein